VFLDCEFQKYKVQSQKIIEVYKEIYGGVERSYLEPVLLHKLKVAYHSLLNRL